MEPTDLIGLPKIKNHSTVYAPPASLPPRCARPSSTCDDYKYFGLKSYA